MKRLLLWSLLLLMMACAGTSSTPQKAVAEVCEQLLDANYDAVLDRMYEWNPQQDEGGEFDMAVWMEQMAAQRVRGIVRKQMESFFEHAENPIESYEVGEVRYASDKQSASVHVAFIRRDGEKMPYTFTMQRVDGGGGRSVKMFR